MAVEPPVALRRDEGAEPERVTGADGRAAGRPAGEAGRPSPFEGGAYVVPLCDGGAVVARDPALLRKIRMFSNHGRESKYLHEFEGINSRLDTLQAALLRVGLPRLDAWNAQRRAAAAWYEEELADLPDVPELLVQGSLGHLMTSGALERFERLVELLG